MNIAQRLLLCVCFAASLSAHAVVACVTPTRLNAETLPQQAAAVATAKKLVIDLDLAPCKTSDLSSPCQIIANDLASLLSTASAASKALNQCATSKSPTLTGEDRLWYAKRAKVWDAVAVEQSNNHVPFALGTYPLPDLLASALTLEPFQSDYTPASVAPAPTNAILNPVASVASVAPHTPPTATAAVAGGVAPTPPAPPTDVSLEAEDAAIRHSETICQLNRRPCAAALWPNYRQLFLDASAAVNANPAVTQKDGQHWQDDFLTLQQGGVTVAICNASPSVPPAALLPFSRIDVSHGRLLAGVDVSAASSADPAARFLFDAAINIPLTGGVPITARSWLWGFARLSSIAQPGASTDFSSSATYVTALTGSSANNIVQSFEATGGYELRLKTAFASQGRSPLSFSAIADGGMITPLSYTQASPTLYVASPALQAYYTGLAVSTPSSINMQNGAAIAAACPAATPPAAAPACYLGQYPISRSRFFRNYAAGLRFKRYYFNDDSNAYIFPAIFDFTIGQNDYVTGGELHRFVAHFGGSTPLPGSVKAFAGITVYAYADMELSRSSIPTNQFLLAPATTVTSASPNVAAILVAQPDRDRYRFGIAFDLPTLFSQIKGK